MFSSEFIIAIYKCNITQISFLEKSGFGCISTLEVPVPLSCLRKSLSFSAVHCQLARNMVLIVQSTIVYLMRSGQELHLIFLVQSFDTMEFSLNPCTCINVHGDSLHDCLQLSLQKQYTLVVT